MRFQGLVALSWAIAMIAALLAPLPSAPIGLTDEPVLERGSAVASLPVAPATPNTDEVSTPGPVTVPVMSALPHASYPLYRPPVKATLEQMPPRERMAPSGIDVPYPPEEPPEEPPEDPPEEPMTPPRIDICYCLDTTGSMSDEIQVVKESILEIAAAIENGTPRPIVRFSLVIFRDIGDAYVTQVFDFMSASELAVVMRNVSARAGGDYPESVSEALYRSVHEVAWDLESDRAIYLIGDAPPHTDYDNGFDHRQAALDAATFGIMINAIGCSGIKGSEAEFMQVAEITGGEFVYLSYTGSAGGGYEGGGGGGGGGWGEDDGPGGVGGVPDCDGEGAGSGTGSSGGTGSGTGSGQGHSNNLDDVLTGMGQGQAQRKGVTYGDEEVAGEDGGSSDSGEPDHPSSPPPGLRRV